MLHILLNALTLSSLPLSTNKQGKYSFDINVQIQSLLDVCSQTTVLRAFLFVSVCGVIFRSAFHLLKTAGTRNETLQANTPKSHFPIKSPL
ncbi:hypothetical protein CW304_27745 [Bacillus sp. UFRGS-B20]|nr:hypothetical protein CW304_27745 [Bacillus sp. UFRGS-B20]